jgi:hypothetical protein
MKEFKATVKEVTPLVDADMGEALGELSAVFRGAKEASNFLRIRCQF